MFTAYRETLSIEKKILYDLVLDELSKHSTQEITTTLSSDIVDNIITMVRFDHPMFFDSMAVSSYKKGNMITSFNLDYRLSDVKYNLHGTYCTNKIKNICRSARGRPIEIVKFMHDYLRNNVTYDITDKETAHSIVGPLLHGKGVCDGISFTMKALLDYCNVESCVVQGAGNKQIGENDSNHAWNMVRLEDEWFHLDVTYDMGLSSEGLTRYDYFVLSDEEISVDHKVVLSPGYKCEKTGRNYYDVTEHSISSKAELRSLLRKRVADRDKRFVVKIKFNSKWRPGIDEIADIINEYYSAFVLFPNKKQEVYEIITKDE